MENSNHQSFHQDMIARLTGISGVHITPYRDDGEINEGLLGKIVDRISSAGIHTIVSAGNTAEFYSLSPEEIQKVQCLAAEANAGRSLMMMAVGRSLREAVSRGKHAKHDGADLLLIHQPMDPFASPHAQAEYFIGIAESVEIPVVAYIRSEVMTISDILCIARHENIVEIKFATTNLILLAQCVNETSPSEIAWICGLAGGWAAPFYSVGARGFTSGFVNVKPEISLAIHSALEAGDYKEARANVARIAGFERMRTKFNNGANVTVVKEAVKILGMEIGHVRLPGHQQLSSEDRSELEAIIKGIS